MQIFHFHANISLIVNCIVNLSSLGFKVVNIVEQLVASLNTLLICLPDTLEAESTPQQPVVTLLNSLYKLFDARIDHYNMYMYKVGTNNDSYMVASRMPVKNGNKHAAEIATMTLDLMAGLAVFINPHRPT